MCYRCHNSVLNAQEEDLLKFEQTYSVYYEKGGENKEAVVYFQK